MSKHTLGPWRILYAQSGYPAQIAGPDRDKHRAGGCNPTRWNGIGFPSSAEGQANANLIAAAPDLLDALIEAMEWNWLDKDMPDNPINMAKAAIAKARGES